MFWLRVFGVATLIFSVQAELPWHGAVLVGRAGDTVLTVPAAQLPPAVENIAPQAGEYSKRSLGSRAGDRSAGQILTLTAEEPEAADEDGHSGGQGTKTLVFPWPSSSSAPGDPATQTLAIVEISEGSTTTEPFKYFRTVEATPVPRSPTRNWDREYPQTSHPAEIFEKSATLTVFASLTESFDSSHLRPIATNLGMPDQFSLRPTKHASMEVFSQRISDSKRRHVLSIVATSSDNVNEMIPIFIHDIAPDIPGMEVFNDEATTHIVLVKGVGYDYFEAGPEHPDMGPPTPITALEKEYSDESTIAKRGIQDTFMEEPMPQLTTVYEESPKGTPSLVTLVISTITKVILEPAKPAPVTTVMPVTKTYHPGIFTEKDLLALNIESILRSHQATSPAKFAKRDTAVAPGCCKSHLHGPPYAREQPTSSQLLDPSIPTTTLDISISSRRPQSIGTDSHLLPSTIRFSDSKKSTATYNPDTKATEFPSSPNISARINELFSSSTPRTSIPRVTPPKPTPRRHFGTPTVAFTTGLKLSLRLSSSPTSNLVTELYSVSISTSPTALPALRDLSTSIPLFACPKPLVPSKLCLGPPSTATASPTRVNPVVRKPTSILFPSLASKPTEKPAVEEGFVKIKLSPSEGFYVLRMRKTVEIEITVHPTPVSSRSSRPMNTASGHKLPTSHQVTQISSSESFTATSIPQPAKTVSTPTIATAIVTGTTITASSISPNSNKSPREVSNFPPLGSCLTKSLTPNQGRHIRADSLALMVPESFYSKPRSSHKGARITQLAFISKTVLSGPATVEKPLSNRGGYRRANFVSPKPLLRALYVGLAPNGVSPSTQDSHRGIGLSLATDFSRDLYFGPISTASPTSRHAEEKRSALSAFYASNVVSFGPPPTGIPITSQDHDSHTRVSPLLPEISEIPRTPPPTPQSSMPSQHSNERYKSPATGVSGTLSSKSLITTAPILRQHNPRSVAPKYSQVKGNAQIWDSYSIEINTAIARSQRDWTASGTTFSIPKTWQTDPGSRTIRRTAPAKASQKTLIWHTSVLPKVKKTSSPGPGIQVGTITQSVWSVRQETPTLCAATITPTQQLYKNSKYLQITSDEMAYIGARQLIQPINTDPRGGYGDPLPIPPQTSATIGNLNVRLNTATSIVCSESTWAVLLVFMVIFPLTFTIVAMELLIRHIWFRGVPEDIKTRLLADKKYRGYERMVGVSIIVLVPILIGVLVACYLRNGICEDMKVYQDIIGGGKGPF
ncbi:hypothetical protein TWF730_002624 [Orbilia blumenaviensis]|uniref:Uncharacterized protein n=1 Tax=Orbilia blumenaviensis TaxID=1796055 RepID=A0AAV9UDG6_9PEZI